MFFDFPLTVTENFQPDVINHQNSGDSEVRIALRVPVMKGLLTHTCPVPIGDSELLLCHRNACVVRGCVSDPSTQQQFDLFNKAVENLFRAAI